MAKRQGSGQGCLALLGLGAVASVWSYSVVWGARLNLAHVLLLVYTNSSKRCGICGNILKQKYYAWDVEGKSKKLCIHCNSTFEREQSRRKISRYKS